jgi:hypothetical protein
MDYVGIDVHKKESQICIAAEGGELIERRVRTEREELAGVLRPRSRAHPARGVDGQRVGRAGAGRAGP